MRLNTPVTQHELVMEDGRTIVSSTDLQGNINYANPYFIEVSGFTEAELIGARRAHDGRRRPHAFHRYPPRR